MFVTVAIERFAVYTHYGVTVCGATQTHHFSFVHADFKLYSHLYVLQDCMYSAYNVRSYKSVCFGPMSLNIEIIVHL